MDAVISAAPVEVAIGGWGIPVGAPVYDAAGEKVGTDAGGIPTTWRSSAGSFSCTPTRSASPTSSATRTAPFTSR